MEFKLVAPNKKFFVYQVKILNKFGITLILPHYQDFCCNGILVSYNTGHCICLVNKEGLFKFCSNQLFFSENI